MRQKTQAVIKDACTKAGIDLELKAVIGSVFSGNDPTNPDTLSKFWADIQLMSNVVSQADPQKHMDRFLSSLIASKSNQWTGRNVSRWSSPEYDETFKAAETELDPVKRAALLIKLNDLVIAGGHIIPIANRQRVRALANKLNAPLSAWDHDSWALGFWSRDA